MTFSTMGGHGNDGMVSPSKHLQGCIVIAKDLVRVDKLLVDENEIGLIHAESKTNKIN